MLGLANVPATELAAELVAVAPSGLSRLFYSDSGAEAVEVGLRIAAQYWQLNGERQRTQFLALTEAYHGDTIGSVSVGFSEPFHQHLRPLLFPALKTDPPHVFRFYQSMDPEAAVDAALEAASRVIREHADDLAALVLEPIMQGAAGMWNHCARYLREMAALARGAGALVIADEVATGFGRTGTMFACEHARLAPDILCLGKGITGGYLPLAATLTTGSVFDAFLGDPEEFRAFYYGHTYTGNPLAAAVACANMALFRDERIIARLESRIAQLRSVLQRDFLSLTHVADIRHVGLMIGIELMRDPVRRVPYAVSEQIGVRVIKAARQRGVIIRPLGNVIVLMPPLAISEKELDHLLSAARESIEEVTAATG
jgi:adenosylmethionine-8-amino-7-oxononanoate aminotransferase